MPGTRGDAAVGGAHAVHVRPRSIRVGAVLMLVAGPQMAAAATAIPTFARLADPLCVQAPSERARTARFDSVLSFRGAGGARLSDGTLLMVWTGVDCFGWFRLQGDVSVDTTWRHLVVPRGARFVAHEETPRGQRDYTIDSNGSATLTIDGRATVIDSVTAPWVDAVVREFVRRSGVGAARRANEILRNQGLQALIDEVARVAHPETRLQYLVAGFSAVKDSGRVGFLRNASELLDDPFARTALLRAVPRAWRADATVLQCVYEEAARVEPDDLVEQLLREMPPPSPIPSALRPSLGRLIATIQSVDRRAALRALYLGDRS